MTRVIVVVVALCAVVFAAYWLGGRDSRVERKLEQSETRGRVNDALSEHIDPDSIDGRLRDLAE
ncbi:hypothetical protein A3734_19360 [Sulfitobacter sp. HI0054]|uniref:hypothetical protein n=1 Tax=Sulfitobacter sp. HI0054 TaxID=1822238 RepID=UPI0007C3E795|nr:hypothetical protein [Sulfitobacter sp. HI0054]KZY52304.1 hypothetical protein A3734_19360 [Sulfitobacter sp. HI0054]